MENLNTQPSQSNSTNLFMNSHASRNVGSRVLVGAFALLVLMLSQVAVLSAQGSSTDREDVPPTLTERSAPGLTFQVGLHGSGDLVMNSASFTTLPGLATCQGDSILYDGSSDPGFSVGARVTLMPQGGGGFGSSLGADLIIGLRSTASAFEADEQIGQTLLPGDNLVPVVTRYSIETSMTSLVLDPSVLFRPSESGLLITLGPSLSFPISSSFDQKEKLVEPSASSFADGRNERNVNSGDIESIAGLLFGAGIGIAYDISLSDQLSLRPSLSGSIAFNGPVSEVDWKQNGLRLGVSLMFSPAESQSNPLTP